MDDLQGDDASSLKGGVEFRRDESTIGREPEERTLDEAVCG
jgi:hypothetical protein